MQFQKRWISRLALASFGIGAGLALLELTLAGLQYGETVLRPHPVYGWSYVPGKEVTWRRPGVRNALRFNARGFRDVEHSVDKPDGVYRILLLGDSMVAGKEVPLDQSFARLLERQLNSAAPGRRFEVINLAVDGFGTDQELLMLKREGLRYRPDLVVLFFFTGNDVSDNYGYGLGFPRPKPRFVLDDRGRLELRPFASSGGGVPHMGSLRNRIFGQLRSYRLLREVVAGNERVRDLLVHVGLMNDAPTREAEERLRLEYRVHLRETTPAWDEAWRLTFRLIGGVHDASTRAGARFLLVYLPAVQELDLPGDFERLDTRLDPSAFDFDKPARLVGAFAREAELPYLSLLPVFRLASDRTRAWGGLYLEHDLHLTPSGHRVTAEAFSAYLLTDPFLRLNADTASGGRR